MAETHQSSRDKVLIFVHGYSRYQNFTRCRYLHLYCIWIWSWIWIWICLRQIQSPNQNQNQNHDLFGYPYVHRNSLAVQHLHPKHETHEPPPPGTTATTTMMSKLTIDHHDDIQMMNSAYPCSLSPSSPPSPLVVIRPI